MAPAPMSYNAVQDEDRRCRHCHSQSLRVDWSQGDRVCTNCGIGVEQHLMEEGPEWRDFNEPEDLIKGAPSSARSGLVIVDETKYLGGLQPTCLSKSVFGGPMSNGSTGAGIRKSLVTTNRKTDCMMEKKHKQAMKQARLSRLIRQKYQNDKLGNEETGMAELDQVVVQEEEQAEQAHAALHAEKWSLERAILLHGTEAQQPTHILDRETERDRLESQMNNILRRAASDLYMAYCILDTAAKKLQLPPRVVQDSNDTLCKYASSKNGITVRGVSSRLSNNTPTDGSASEKLRDYNRHKQMASLACALLFLEARKHGHERSMQQVCGAFLGPHSNGATKEAFLKLRHCSKAMNELREVFPDYMRAVSGGAHHGERNVDQFVEHTTRKLQLPPVAVACVQALVPLLQKMDDDANESRKQLSTRCASTTLFVSTVGDIMQRLGRQSQAQQSEVPKTSKRSLDDGQSERPNKLAKMESSGNGTTKKSHPFDLFSHPAIGQDDSHKSYEMRKMWDAWLEQIPWSRQIGDIEQSCTVSRSLILDYFKTRIYPRRLELLSILRDKAAESANNKLRRTPRASLLLSRIPAAAPLIGSNGKA